MPRKEAGSDAGSSRGRAPSEHPPNVVAGCDDDDDDFMPMPPPRAPLPPENSDDEVQPDPRFTPLPPVPKMKKGSFWDVWDLHKKFL